MIQKLNDAGQKTAIMIPVITAATVIKITGINLWFLNTGTKESAKPPKKPQPISIKGMNLSQEGETLKNRNMQMTAAEIIAAA